MMRLTKIIKIILINVAILALLVAMIETILFNEVKNDTKEKFKIRQEMNKKIGQKEAQSYKYSFTVPAFSYIGEKSKMRKPEGLMYKKPPILLFGCSFTYGDGLENKDTFSYKLSHYLKRPVYNRSAQGWGIQHVYYQLTHDDVYNEVPEPKYIIYTLMSDHINRIVRYQFQPPYNYVLLRYKLTDKGFEEIHPFLKPLWSLHIVNKIQYTIEKNVLTSNKNKENNLLYFSKMLIECKKLAEKHYPNSKFVIFIYRDQIEMFSDNENFLKKLKDAGFIIIDSDELTPKGALRLDSYRTNDHSHPSGKAWDLIIPGLVKKLKL